MKTQEKLTYMIKIYKSCKTDLQLRNTLYWINSLVNNMNLDQFTEQEFRHQLRISNHFGK